ncbi:MAG: hypothetical protein A3A32_02800 [Candidatus Wildermuthbacteria bacterium RIFCSPLOWO2_01_FULL_48_35]|uniref:Uncharacterized protein n=1 Tax=Candidatus Wildermuthbacteria bacterium RIFCSPLOWO2_01_FULL_48_35 TaxID=1802463 RepID=A0A1G2RMD6_9BACT|nr:MAG: hypothetical protein A3A32_02800 [Candidatus Wildermuthbacteria bacterium RIFCSPLOWO2_01_FULL_48_35]
MVCERERIHLKASRFPDEVADFRNAIKEAIMAMDVKVGKFHNNIGLLSVVYTFETRLGRSSGGLAKGRRSLFRQLSEYQANYASHCLKSINNAVVSYLLSIAS